MMFAGIIKIIELVAGVFVPAAKTVIGDQASRDTAAANENAAAREAYGKEFSYPAASRTYFDSLIDGINRLPRPLMALGTIGLFIWCAYDPKGFAVAMTSLALIPEMLWNVMILIVGFYFTSRAIEKLNWGAYKVPKAAEALARKAIAEQAEERVVATETNRPHQLVSMAGDVKVSSDTPSLLRLAGYGDGILTRGGYTGRLPQSRAAGWVNPIASRYAAT